MSSLDLDILEILTNCAYPLSSYRNFAGLSRAELRRLSYNDLEARLRSTLPPSPDRPSLVSRFISSLSNPEGAASHTEDIKPLIKQEIKVEVADSSTGSNPASPPPPPPQPQHGGDEANVPLVQPENSPMILEEGGPATSNSSVQSTSGQGNDHPQLDSDSEVEFVEEVENVSIIRVLDAETKAKERTLHVTLQDEEGEEGQQMEDETLSSGTASFTPITVHLDGDSSTPSSPELARRRKRKPKPVKKLQISDGANGKSYDPPKLATKTIFRLGKAPAKGSIRTLEWTLNSFKNLTSPRKSPFVKELSIISNCNYEASSTSSGPLSLPLLATLKIRHRVKESDDSSLSSIDINYSSQLTRILAGAPLLSRIEISYEDEVALKSLLGVLGSIPELGSLSSLLIKHREEDKLTALVASDVRSLAKINAPNLAELQLSFCIWADDEGFKIKKAVESMLGRFPNLAKLKIEGCFVISMNRPPPQIVLDFPKFPKLQVLDLGASCKYGSTFETVEEAPKKKKRKKLVIRAEPEGGQDDKDPANKEPDPVLPDNLIEDMDGEYFSVSINLPGLMPSLTSIRLGVLYEFKTLYFSELPNLKIFRVASQWAQSYPAYFPLQAPRRSQGGGGGGGEGEGAIVIKKCPVVELQFPDAFQDDSLLPKILRHFPNLTHVYINLPTVKFLRAFAKTMADLGPESFAHLILKTQFDFASSLDSCILDKIVEPSLAELQKIRILKAYPHWEDYVKENSIEVPAEEVNGVAEDGTKYCGLFVLLKKLKTVGVRHIPRTLRLPQGTRHWIDHPHPEYTDTLIGFKEYPFHKVAKKKCPKRLKIICHDFDMSQVAEDFKVKPYYESGQVPLDPTNSGIKKEVKAEQSKPPSSIISI